MKERLNARYPTWQKISGVESFDTYINDAKLDGWIDIKKKGSKIHITRSNDDKDLEDEKFLSDRFGPLVKVLEEAHANGEPELELAQIGILLRKITRNPLDRLGVSQLKEYVLEAEEQGKVKVRQEGLQNYISLIHRNKNLSNIESAEVRQILDLLEQALETLKEDRMQPTGKVVIGRMREIKPGWDVYKSVFGSIEKLLEAGKEKRGIIVRSDRQNPLVFPASGEYEYIDPNNITEDSFSREQLRTIFQFFMENRNLQANGRYGLAKRLREENLPYISNLSLGELTALVQYCVNTGLLEFHYNKIQVKRQIINLSQ